ncbi:hypothetical protein QVD17_26505 [Tagetes erecta]|uniref:Uncharacterized protein n=1 Tax=Tagetes erecta TaxID=13708 RepID=A0AAD8NQU7_TARER|nr:hypothetical protein QVD17_26505 [Tagetes erecta]
MVPSQSNTTNTNTIVRTNHLPPLLTIPPPSPSPSPSQTTVSSPVVIDLLRCDHRRFSYRFTRKLKRYLKCFKSEESEKKTGLKNGVIAVNSSITNSPNYYSDMNDEERDEKLKSAIVYCNNGTD